jgi:GAF domain-containing protein
MSATPNSTFTNPEHLIDDLQRQLADIRRTLDQRTVERDEAQRQLAERTTERDEALAREAATAEVLQVINSSPGDLTPVFDAILEKAHSLCGADHGSLFFQDREIFRAIASRGMPEAMTGPLRAGIRANDSSLAQPLMAGEPFVHVHDSALDEHPNWIKRALDVVSSHRTLLSIPLRKNDALLGMIVAGRFEIRPFTDKQIALLQNFAAQAVIAMENARLITETREALEQQTATAEVLQVINSSPGDLAPVFEAVLDKALMLCGGTFGIIRTYDGNSFHFGAMRGVPPEIAQLMKQPRRPPFTGMVALERIVAGEPVVEIGDPRDLAGYRAGAPTIQAMVDRGGARSGLWVALRKEAELLGFIWVYRQEIRPFTDRQIALLQNFASQAVIAIENARLLTETREALEQQTATAEVLQVINSSPGDLAPVFDAMLEKATRLCEASFGILWSFSGDLAVAGALYRVPESYAKLCRVPFRPSPGSGPARMIQGENGFALADVAQYPPYLAGDELTRAIVDLAGARSVVIEPLRKDDVTLGAITLYRQEVRPFTDKQVALLQNFAAQAVIAMENARLLTETREALEQQTATAEVLQVINSSPGDLEPVFEAILQKAHDLCGTGHGALLMRDGERFKPVAFHDAPEPIANYLRQYGLGPDAPAVGPLLDGARFVHIPDMRDIDHPGARAAVANGVRTLLSVPLRKDGLVGTINAVRFEVRPFVDKEISLLENFAAQAVIAIENARLLGELRQRTDEVAELNRGLEARVAEQVEELGRVGRLKRFLAPQLAELIVSQGDEKILESHRREIVVVFCDLRGYTAFTETAEPEEVLDFLREYHGALGPLVSQFEGTLDQFSGDGIMVFFNDPVPCPDPAERAVKMAMAMREEAGKLITTWRRDGCELGFGAGIAQGYATLGQIGFSERSGYTAIGTVCNLAARLCAEAKDGQILISSRVARAVEAVARLEDLGNLELRGLRRPVAAFNVVQSTSAADARPNLTVVASGPGA